MSNILYLDSDPIVRHGLTTIMCCGYPCTTHLQCEQQGKRPLVSGWSTLDPEVHDGPFRVDNPPARYNTAVRTGRGLLVVDIDGQVGEDALARAEEMLGPLPVNTLTCLTSRGRHMYFRVNGVFKCSAGQITGPGLDIRCDGGYVIAPPSIHRNGEQYRWVNPKADILPLPDNWLIEVGKRGAVERRTPGSSRRISFGEGTRDAGMTSLAGLLVHRGFSHEAVYEMLQGANRHHCDPPLPSRDLYRIANSIAKYGSDEKLVNSLEQQRKQIVVSALTYNQDFAEVRSVLETCGEVFSRGGDLVCVATQTELTATGPIVTHQIKKITLEILAEIAGRFIDFRTKDTKGNLVPVTSGAKIVREILSQILAHPNRIGFPVLVSAQNTPSIRLDGSAHTTFGFDPDTGVYLTSNEFESLRPGITREDARAAWDLLATPFLEFPWSDPGPALAAIVTTILAIVARRAIRGPLPLLAIDANTPGAGKGLSAQTIVQIATGDGTQMTSFPEREEELEKRLMTKSLQGGPVLLLDNVARPVDSPSLQMVLTSESVAFRRLGVHEMVSRPWHTQVILTGNNLRIAGDTVRRTLRIRTEPQTLEGRVFTISDLPGWVGENRGRLLEAALTILHAHALAGRPIEPGLGELKSFEGWRSVAAAACHWASGHSPITAQDSGESDSTLADIEVFGRWLSDKGGKGLTVKEIVDALWDFGLARSDESDDVRVAITSLVEGPNPDKAPDQGKFKSVLDLHKGRPLTFGRIQRHPGRVGRWYVR